MVLEYVTDRLVETAANEIERGRPVLLVEQPLIQAQAKDYVRQTQERLLGTPLLQRLTAHHGADGTAQRLLALLEGWRGRPEAEQGYAPGNLVNLLRVLRGDLRGLDLSRLAIRQAYLAEVEAQDASLAGAHLAETVLAEALNFTGSVALSADGAFLAAGTSTGQVCLWRVADRMPLWAVPGHAGAVWAVALAANGHLLASSGTDATVRLWQTSTGQLLQTLQGHTGLRLLACGLANKEITRELSIAEKTVKTHVSSILGKLGVQSRTQAALYAGRIGLVPIDQLGGGKTVKLAEPEAQCALANLSTTNIRVRL